MCRAVATRPQMNRTVDATRSDREYGVASLVRSFIHPESLAAEREHFGHERHVIDSSMTVEGFQNLLFAPDFNPIAGFQAAHLHLLRDCYLS
jgi:hypothetical protein